MSAADSFDPAERNRQLDEEKARQENSGKKDGGPDGSDILKPHDKADPAKLQEIVPRSSGNADQDHSVAAQWGRETYGVTPRDITFGTESGKVIYGKEYNENGKPMLLSPDGTRYEGTMNADGKGIASWQQVNSDGKMGPALNVTAERSGLPPNPAKPETYVNSNQARRENEGGGNPARPTLPAGDTSTARQARANQNEALNFAPLHKGDVPQAQPAKTVTSDAAPRTENAPQKNFSEMTRQERRDVQQQSRDAGGGGNPWKAVDQQGVTRTLGGDRLTARGANSNPENPNQPAKPESRKENRPENQKPETKTENPKATERSTTGGSQPFDAAPRQQRPVNESQPGKPDAVPSKENAKDAGGPHGDGRGKPGPADIFPAAPKPDHGGIGLKLSPDAAKRLADLIGDMQSGKALGRDNIDIGKLLGGMKPEQLAGLKNALADGKFDMSQLDGKMQANLSKAFEQLAKGPHEGIGRAGGPQELGAAGRVLDLLQSKQFDKIPTGDQTRQILAELFKGFKDGGSLAGSVDLSAMLGRSLMKPGELVVDGRSLGQITGMKFDLKDAGPIVQTLMARMELGKINEGSISQLGKLADVVAQKLDTRDGATLEVKAELKAQSNLDISKLSDTVRSALMGGELGRAIGRETGKDGQATSKDANPAALVQDGDAAPAKAQTSDLSAAGTKTEAELTQKRLEDEAAKQKKQQDEIADTIKQKGLTAEQIAQELAQMQKMEEQRKAQEKEEKERREREEKKRREDEERVHIVKKGETLHIISRKYFNNDKNAQIIYARNKSTIKVVNYKGQPYCSLKEKQKLYIPSPKFVDSFMKGTTSYNHINFGKIPFSTPEEELAFLFGGADLGAAAGLLGINKKRPSLFNHDDDSEPVSRRSFSGKDASVDDEERKANVEQILNPVAAVKKPVEMEGIRHTIRLGETLSSIALRRYGQAAYWRLIAWKNKLAMEESTAHSKMTRGLILYMPTNDEMSAYDANPDRMLSLRPSKVGIFIESKNGISMPALKICGECGRTTFYTAQSCMRCETDLSDIPIIIDALGVGVELDLIDLDGHLPGEESAAPGNGNGAHQPTEDSASREHQMQYREIEAPSADLVAKELSKELTDSIVPHQEVENMDPAVLAAMSQAESSEQVDHVGDIPLPEVAFAQKNAKNVYESVPNVVPEDKAIDATNGQNFAEQESSAADQMVGERSDVVPEAAGKGLAVSHDELEHEVSGARINDAAFDELNSKKSSLSQQRAAEDLDDVQPAHSSEEDNDGFAGRNNIQRQVNENRSGDADSAAEQAMSPSELMQHSEEDEAAMMELFPDCDSVLDESILKCEYVDEMVRIAERGDVDSRDGFCVTLEMVCDGSWSKVCQYRIYGFNCFIEVYCRANGSRRPERVQEKSLQSKIAIEMAWNHFNRNWQEMCTEFWHS